MRIHSTKSTLGLAVAVLMVSSAGQAAQQPTASRPGQSVGLSYICDGIAGSSMAAPGWKAMPDGASNQQLRIRYRGNQEIAEASWTIRDEAPYYEAVGLGVAMQGGLSIFVFADDYVETYVYNAGTTELLYTSIRAGSGLLPNTIKSFRGSCRPGGAALAAL